jgi:hypothetical protein
VYKLQEEKNKTRDKTTNNKKKRLWYSILEIICTGSFSSAQLFGQNATPFLVEFLQAF